MSTLWHRFRDWRAARRLRWVEKQAAVRRDDPGYYADQWKGGGRGPG
jgi:hypothetical protein